VALASNGRFLNPAPAVPSATPGLHMAYDYMGFHNGSAWMTYMDSGGNFYLGGTGGALRWNAGAGTLYINGNGVFSGSLSAATGTFTGSLVAATGTFSGSLSAASGTFTGALSGATGSFTGTVTAGGGAVVLDSQGITVATPVTAYAQTNSYKFDNFWANGQSGLYGYMASGGVAERQLGVLNRSTAATFHVINVEARGRTLGGVDHYAMTTYAADSSGSNFGVMVGQITHAGSTAVNTSAPTIGLHSTANSIGLSALGGGVNVSGNMSISGIFLPTSDGAGTVGQNSLRFNLVRAITITAGDLGFENGWALTESYKVGIEDPGIALVDDTGELIAFFGKSGFKARGLQGQLDIDNVAHAKTTGDERAEMDLTPEKRTKGFVPERIPECEGEWIECYKRNIVIPKTPADVRPTPNPRDKTKVQSTNERKGQKP
jgi:hypothetical protein